MAAFPFIVYSEPGAAREDPVTIPHSHPSEAGAKEPYEPESIFPGGSESLAKSHFTWGVDVGSSIDLSGTDLSTIDAEVVFGYKNDLIRILGLGAGVQHSLGNSDSFIPVYIVFRSSFRRQPSLFFFNLKAGYSFNTISESATRGDIAASLGLGINLAMSRRFQSHIVLSWAFRHFTHKHQTAFNLGKPNINMAQLTFGVNF